MNSKTLLIAVAIGSLFAMAASEILAAEDPATERCYGIAKAGKNDCAVPGHVGAAGMPGRARGAGI